jgi:MoaA/NifB/PqqE/SkfB family radical SAM enzyme
LIQPDDRPDEKPSAEPSVEYGRGWFDWEKQDIIPFRWMSRDAELSITGLGLPDARFLTVVARHLFADQRSPRLEVFVEGRFIGQALVPTQFTTLFFPFAEGGDVSFTLRLDRVHSAPGDGRSLGIMVQSAGVVSAATQKGPVYSAGWYGWETEDTSTFRWMGLRGEIMLPWKQIRSHRYLTFPVFLDFYDSDQILTLSYQGRSVAKWPVIQGWEYCSFDLALLRDQGQRASEAPAVLELSVNKLHPTKHHAGDGRELGVRIGPLEFHDDDAWHADSTFFRENARKNYEEMRAGRTVLSSFPLSLGVDLFGRCNIHPPCVYCLWDQMKEMEGAHIDTVVDDSTLKSYGPFFRSARYLVNCSFGEPLLHPRLGEVLSVCAERKKIVELSSNGQALTDRTIRALVGKPVNLYVSLDAATRETYAKIRNDRWDDIVPSLVKLNEERKKAGRLPRLFLVFIPMRVNAGDLEEYFRLARRIDADKLVLRPLQFPVEPKNPIDRGGYRFDFGREPLSREELEALFGNAERFARQYGIELASQFDFGKPVPRPTGKATPS